MKWLLSCIIIFLTLNAFSDDVVVSFASSSYKIVSLYEKDALLTGRFLPFKIYDQQSGEPQEIISIATSSGCYGMVDIHRSDIVHIYCKAATQAKASIVLSNGSVVAVSNLEIKKLSIIDAVEPEIIKPGDTPGKRLFTNNCKSCHVSEPINNVMTVNSLKDKFKKVSEMKQFDGAYDNIQLEELVKYINEEVVQ